MLTEKELKDEIKLIQQKIDVYEKEIEPFLELENLIHDKMSKFGGNELSINLVIQQKSSKVAMIKSWEKEILVYKRILNGKRMDKLQEPRYVEKTKAMITKAIEQIKRED